MAELPANYLFPVQVTISLLILFFSMYQLSIGKDAGVYLPIISGILGNWLPHPLHGNEARRKEERDIVVDIEQPLLR